MAEMTRDEAAALLERWAGKGLVPSDEECRKAFAVAIAALRSPGAAEMREAAIACVREQAPPRDIRTVVTEAQVSVLDRAIAAIRALPLPAPEVPDHWTATKDAMPEKSRGFLAFCQGFKEHSGVTWRRTGFAFMAWHPPGWSEQHMRDARKRLDADSLEVTHWMYLTEPKEIV